MGDKLVKVYDASLDVNAGKREVLAVISTNAIDRDGEIVKPQGLKKKNFSGNPVVMVNHDYHTLPIGKALWVKAQDDKVLAKYYVSDKTQLSNEVFGLLQDGVLNAHSIGFLSLHNSPPTTQELNAAPDMKGAKLIHRSWEMLEFSVVGIPANPEALTLAVSKGYSSEILDILTGKAKRNQQAAAEVVKAVAEQVEAKPQLSSKEIIKAIENTANAMTLNIDVDKVVAAAFDALKR